MYYLLAANEDQKYQRFKTNSNNKILGASITIVLFIYIVFGEMLFD